MLSELSQIEKEKYCMVSFICGIFKKQNRMVLPEGSGVVAGQRAQTGCKRSESWGCNGQHAACSSDCIVQALTLPHKR